MKEKVCEYQEQIYVEFSEKCWHAKKGPPSSTEQNKV
jgi:hypothetical protein